MAGKAAQVVQADIAGDLEFQHRPGGLQGAEQLAALFGAEVLRIQAVADPQEGHLLPGEQGVQHALHAVADVAAQAVVFSRVDAQDKAGDVFGQMGQGGQQGTELADVVHLFPDDVAAGDVRVGGGGAEGPKLGGKVRPRGLVPDDGQGDPAERPQKTDQDAGLFRDGGHHAVYLAQEGRGPALVQQGRVGNLRVADPEAAEVPGHPEQLVLQNRVGAEDGMPPVLFHFLQIVPDIPVRHGRKVELFKPLGRRLPAGKDVAVQVDLFQVGKNGLAVL